MSTDDSDEWVRAVGAFAAARADEGRALATVRVESVRLRAMAAAVSGSPWTVGQEQVVAWLDGLGGSPATVKAYRSVARAFFVWAVARGERGDCPVPPARVTQGDRLSLDWRTAVEHFGTAEATAGMSAATVTARRKHVVRFAADSAAGPWAATPEDVDGWLAALDASDAYRLAARTSLRAFYRWAAHTGRVVHDPAARARRSSQALDVPASWQDPIREYRAYIRGGKGQPETTATAREQHLRQFARAHAARDPFALTLLDLLDWLGTHPEWAQETRRSRRSTLVSFYDWAELVGHVTGSPAARLPVIRAVQPSPRPVHEDAYAAALRRAAPRERLALRMAAELGMRRSEVAQSHSRDLLEQGGEWSLRVHGKGGKPRTIPLPDELARLLRSQPAGHLFPGQGGRGHLTPRYLAKRLAALLPPGETMHGLRHRFATVVYAVDHDTFAVQQLLGHASPATTQRYIAVSSVARRRLVEAAAPRAAAP